MTTLSKKLYRKYPESMRKHGHVTDRMNYRLEQTKKFLTSGKCKAKLFELRIVKNDKL